LKQNDGLWRVFFGDQLLLVGLQVGLCPVWGQSPCFWYWGSLPLQGAETFDNEGIKFREYYYYRHCGAYQGTLSCTLYLDSPLPVPTSEKNLSSAAVIGLLSSSGIQYLQFKNYQKAATIGHISTILHAADLVTFFAQSVC